MNNMVLLTEKTFMEKIGLGALDTGYLFLAAFVLILLLLVLLIVLFKKNKDLNARLDKFMTGKNSKSLEQELIAIVEDNKFLKASVEKNRKDIRTLFKRMESTIQKVSLVRYDAFNQMGGTLSFVLCLLDENNNGVMINSVHSNEGCYIYSKNIENGTCLTEMGKEEKKALEEAMGE